MKKRKKNNVAERINIRYANIRRKWTPTTKPCSDCGYHNEALTLSDRQWRCPECGSHHDREVNAAINILRAARDPVVEQM